MKELKKTMNWLSNCVNLDNFDELINDFIEKVSYDIAKLYHIGEHKKARRLEKKVKDFLRKVKISRNIYLGKI